MNEHEIFAPYDKLIELDICGRPHMVPENNSLLRCFQFISIESISDGDLCWNGDCINCRVWLENGDKERAVLACRTKVAEGMKIVRMAEEIGLSTADSDSSSLLTNATAS